jgi:dipeptidase E
MANRTRSGAVKSLYLSPYNFGRAPEVLADLVAPRARAAIIMNATDVYAPDLRPAYVESYAAVLAGLGIDSDELDLRDYFGEPRELEARLSRYGLIWSAGGNAFVLRRAMRYTGFDAVAANLVETGDLVYAGCSAGAIVATPTLAGIECADDPNDVPAGYEAEIIWDGLDLFGKSIAPHYRSGHPESAVMENVIRSFTERGLTFQALRDGEAIVVRGDDIRIVGQPTQ